MMGNMDLDYNPHTNPQKEVSPEREEYYNDPMFSGLPDPAEFSGIIGVYIL